MPKSANTADEYEFVNHDETALSPEVLDKIREWLQPTDYLAESGEFRRHLASQAPGTGLWICETDEYRKWHDSPDHGSLWIKGIPGAGKSVTAASIIQHLRVTEDCPILFFFFRNIVAANFTPRALFQDWLAQLLPHSPRLQFALQSRLDSSLAETSDNDLIQLFLDGVSSVSKLYCVADALDEMTSDNKPFLDKLNGLATYRPRSLKLLITSRPKQYLQSALRDSSIVHISLQQQLVDADILSYLNHRFDTAPKSDARDRIKQQVVSMVARRSESLFLYAKLTMDQVEAALLVNDLLDINKLEESLPVGLEEMYTTVLAKQRQENGVSIEVQVLVLEAVTHASRPLRLYELASLIKCVCPEAKAPKGFKTLVATCCGPLVEILEDETLQVIHHSFTEFLRGDSRNVTADDASMSQFPVIVSNKAHKRMAISCLQYLQSGSLLLENEIAGGAAHKASVIFNAPSHQVDLDERHYRRSILGMKEERDAFNYREARLLHPFLSYAVENWSFHASRYDVRDEELFAAIAGFLNPNSLAFLRWLVLQWGSTTKAKESTEGIPTALHIAAFSGLSELANQLIQQGSSVSDVDAQDRIPLHWAATNGHAKVASLLIQHGSNPDAEDGRGLKPLHLAARKNHAAVVTILLEAGVEPDTIKTKENHAGRLLGGEKRTKGETAILYVSEGGHTESVKAIVPFCKPATLEELLCECCRYGRVDAVLAILDISDVSADAVSYGATALYFACHSASVQIAEALIKRGADVCKPSEWAPRQVINGGYRRAAVATPPLHRLVQDWGTHNDKECRAILNMLIKANVDLEQLDGRGNTPLLIAAGAPDRSNRRHLNLPAIQPLLDAGADVKVLHSSGDTALHLVLRAHRSPEAVQALVEHGSDPNQKGNYGQTALHCSMQQTGMVQGTENTEDIVRYLLEHGADPNQADDRGNTPVYQAMSAGPEVFQILLSRCNNVLVKKQCWFLLSSEYHHEKFVKYLDLLLAEGIDINIRNKNGRTLYLCCLHSDEKLRTLRDRGAKSDVVDNSGNNSLHILCQGSSCVRERLEKLIANDGLDPLTTNGAGNTLLHDVAYWYTSEPKMAEYVRWIVSLGVPVNAVNNEGSTALHVLQRGCPSGSTIHHDRRVHFVEAVNENKDLKFEIRDKNGLTPLHLAVMQSETEVATLLAAGAELRFLTEDSQNVLHLASRARQPNILGQILEHAACPDVNQQDSFGRTPLHYACSSGDPESVALFLRHGADVHAVDSDKRTPLHACVEFTAEQDIWDLHSQSDAWLRGPPRDPLRPGARPRRLSELWYRYRYGSPRPGIRRTYFSGVGVIVKMLLDARADVSAAEKQNHTALDLALQAGCAEVVEVFATDEELFADFIKGVENDPKNSERSDQIQKYMRAQMTLMRPRSSLQALEGDKVAYDEVAKSPNLFLELLTSEDAAKLVNEGFANDSLAPSHYRLLEEIMKPGHLQLTELVSQLVLHYSTYESVREKVERARSAGERYIDNPAFTALQLACRSEKPNLQVLKLLVEKLHVDVNASCATHHGDIYDRESDLVPGGTALHVLASADTWWQVDAMRYLIAKGADVNAQDEKGQAPIHVAARGMKHNNQSIHGFWRLSAVRVLLSHGADPNILDNKGLSSLHKASAAPDVMRELLRNGADPTATKQNPLFQAIYDQNLAALETLLDNGVSVDSLDERRHSRDVHYTLKEPRKVYALLCAAFAEQLNRHVPQTVPLLRALIERGADLYLPLNDNEKMIHFLFEWPVFDVLDTLLKEPCVSRIDFNHRDQRGRTVLMAACDWREVLPGYSHLHWDPKASGPPLRILDRKADATLVDNSGKTALHHLLNNPGMPDDVLVQFINRKEVAPTLLKKDGDGLTPFHYALRILRPVICDLLLSKGASLLEPDPNGLTCLHYIANQCLTTTRSRGAEGHLNIDLPKDYFDQCLALWQRFIKEGGSINVKDDAGNTPLLAYLSAPDMYNPSSNTYTCHVDHYDKLFPTDCGVDVFAANHEGETALHIITKRGKNYYVKEGHDKALFELMMAKGLDPLKEDVKGRSAIDVASACEKEDIVKLLRRK